jgi:hypothetical protein
VRVGETSLVPTDDLRAAFARAAADDGIVLGPQTFDWPCVQGYLGLERVAKARRDPAIAEPVKSALENLGAIYARFKGDVSVLQAARRRTNATAPRSSPT